MAGQLLSMWNPRETPPGPGRGGANLGKSKSIHALH